MNGGIPEDGWRPLETLPRTDIRVLLIEGYCTVPWMQEHIIQCFRGGGGFTAKRVWVTDPSHLTPEDEEPDAFGVDSAVKEIESGTYHGIVVVDYCCMEYFEEFENSLGPHVQKFVDNGGVVAFPSSESLLVSTLEKLFGTTWERSGYYRTTWGPCPENENLINYSFGNYARRIIRPFSAKANTLRNVPAHERCFGVTPESRTQSLVPFMNGRDVSRPDDPDSVASVELEPDYDIVVAVHDYGKGCIAYFGDVNCEDMTRELVAAFIGSRCPQDSIDCWAAALDDETFTCVEELKDRGNEAFKHGNLEEAIALYNSATDKYATTRGAPGEQREMLVTLLSNTSLAYARLEALEKSEVYATRALSIDPDHGKSLYRRATARYKISLSKPHGDMSRLRDGETDLINMGTAFDPSTREDIVKLLEKISNEIKRLEKKQRLGFGAGLRGNL